MKSRRRSFIALGACLLAACAKAPEERVQRAARVREAAGRVTRIDASNAPEVVPVPPERTVKGGPFLPPAGDGGGATAHMHTYGTDDGLAMDDISCAYLDPSGMLWFGTNGGGISRFDGHAFRNFTMAHGLPDNTILTIGGDGRGDLWIGTSTGGLCRYDGRTFVTLPVNDAQGLSRGITCMLEDPDGTLWFGSRGHGLYRFDGSGFTTLPVIDPQGRDQVRCMARTPDGALWVATQEGLARHDGRSFQALTGNDGAKLSDVESMAIDAAGDLWLGHAAGGVTQCVTDRTGTRFIPHRILEGGTVRVSQLLPDPAGGLWIASPSHGAIRFDPRSEAASQATTFGTGQGLASNEVLCLTRDRHGDLWFGTRGAGITHYRGGAFSNFRGIKPISIAQDHQGVLWVGTDRGLARFDGHGFSEQRDEALNGWTYSVSIDPTGRVGFGKNMLDPGSHGISWFDGRDYHVIGVEDDRTYPDLFWTFHDRRGRLWAGGRRGVEMYAAGHRTSYTTRQGLGSNLVLFTGEDRNGSILVGTDGGGFSRIDSTTVTTWTTREGLPHGVVWNIQEETGGTLWITTLAGLSRSDGRSFLTFTTHDGLPDDNINQALLTHDGGELLIGTLNGLAVITGWKDPNGADLPFSALNGAPNDTVARYSPVIEVYNTATGYPVKDVQTAEHALFEDDQGVIWIATGSDKTGLVRFDRKAMRADSVPPGVELLNVTVNNERVCWYDLDAAAADSATLAQQEVRAFGRILAPNERAAERGKYRGITFLGIRERFPIPEGLVLNYRNNHIGFEFVGVETARPEVVEYRTMLEGYDARWNPVTRLGTADFGNIREGDYIFKVKARGPSGAWSEPVEYRFSVSPPIHRTWWAILIYVLAGAGAIVLFVRWRTSSLKRQHRKLARLVAVRTEELSRKKQEADTQRSRAELSEKAKEQFLANMSHEIRTPMNAIMGMSDILKSRPHAPEQAKYLAAISQSSENLLVIINDILDLSKINAGRIEFERVPFDPRAVLANVQAVVQIRADAKKLPVELRVAADVPRSLLGDPTRLNQIVLNLAGNAVKFTEQGGVEIAATVGTEGMEAGRVELVIAVADSGIGIPEDRIEKIFEEFTQAYSDTTRKYGGTGLGLTISKRLVELQGGSITVKSERGKGSVFTVRIPCAIA